MRTALVLLIFLAGSVFSEELAQEARGWQLMETFAAQAPARQVGQPGNEWVDRWVENTFQTFVERSGGGSREDHLSSQSAWDSSIGKILQSRNSIYLEEVSPSLFSSGEQADVEEELVATRASFSTAIARSPLPVIFLLIGVLALLLIAWWFQRRTSLLWLAGVATVLLAFISTIAVNSAATSLVAGGASGSGAASGFTRAIESFFGYRTEAAAANRGIWQRGRIRSYTAAYIPGEYSIQTGGQSEKIYQLAPNLTDPGNFQSPEIQLPFFYGGTGSFEELRVGNLKGTVVFLEFNSGSNWVQAVEMGAEAVVFLEPAEGRSLSTQQAFLKISNTPLSIPRFYLPRPALDRLVGVGWEQGNANGQLLSFNEQPAKWKRTPIYTDWLYIPGKDPDDLSGLVHIQTFKDAASVVPELSAGAESTANLAAIPDLLDRLLKDPPLHPILVSVVNDHSNALNGEYTFSSFAFTPSSAFAQELDRLDYLYAQKLLVAKVYSQKPDARLLEYMRSSIERVGGRSYTVKETIVNHLTMLRNSLRGEQNLLTFQLQQSDLPGLERIQMESRMKESSNEVTDVIALLGLFNRFGHRTEFSQLNPGQVQTLAEIFGLLSKISAREAVLLDEERRIILDNLSVRALLSSGVLPERISSWLDFLDAAAPPLPSVVGIHLDLGLGSKELGMFFIGESRVLNPRGVDRFSRAAADRTRRFARLALEIAGEISSKQNQPPFLRDTFLTGGSDGWRTHLGLKQSFASSSFHQFAQGSVTITSVADLRPVLFTPDDTLERIDRDVFERQLGNVTEMLCRLTKSDQLPSTMQLRGTPSPVSVELTVRQMDRFSVGIPQTLLPNALVLGYPFSFAESEALSYFGQVRRFPILMADDFGRLTVRGELWKRSSVLAFGFNEDFRKTIAALDFGENEGRFASTIDLTVREMFTHRSLVTFESQKTDFYGFNNPLTFEPVPNVEILDARTDSRPRHYSIVGTEPFAGNKKIPLPFDGTLSVFVEPDMPFKIRSGNIFAIKTTPDNLSGEGFPSGIPAVRDLPWIMANDYQSLASSRLALLASKGVTSDAGDRLNEETVSVIEEAAVETSEGNRRLLAEIARGLGFRTYTLTINIIHDLVVAVVILLALIVPFCFFLVKLLSPFSDFNRQLFLFMGVFAFFAVLLYFIQPAFAVGDRPQIIILAFVILGLALFVGSVILGKFNAAMNQAVEQMQLSETADAPQGRLVGAAFMVGVNNMKKRRIRTTLTCATIVLVTFTILSVISVKEGGEPLRLKVGAEAPYNGFTFVRPGLAPISPMQVSRLRSHFADRAETILRTWSSRQDEFGGYLSYYFHPENPVPGASIDSLEVPLLLGLETGERDFITRLEDKEYLLEGSRWFSANDAKEMMISRRAAALLGISEDNFSSQVFQINGMDLKLVGIFEDDSIGELRDLRKLPFLPLKLEATAVLTDSAESTSAGDITESPGVQVASGVDVIFLPVDIARSIGGAENRVLGVKYKEAEGESPSELVQRMWSDIQKFLRYQQAYLGVGLTEPVMREESLSPLDSGEYALASSSSAEIGGVLKIAIPVILAATIILNTMLGSVMERKKEISIYNAIGLNPTHVMIFFLAEALVFGLVGSVAGYFIGQLMSVGLGQFIDLNLNYSSLSVMVVIFLTIATVMLSTLYPASMAAKAAVPSGQRRWCLPQPEGDQIHLRFPFSYDARRIFAVCAYLHEFMKQNSEASTGKFLAALRVVGRVPSKTGTGDSAEAQGDQPHEALAMVYDITPIPFDLGVNQKMEIYADYDQRVKAYMLSVHLTRESGEVHSWTTVNQPFLEALRKRLLTWRSQRPEIQESYFVAGEALFRNSAHLEVVGPADDA